MSLSVQHFINLMLSLDSQLLAIHYMIYCAIYHSPEIAGMLTHVLRNFCYIL